MHEAEEKTLNSLVPLGLIRAFQGWFRGFQGQRVGDPRPCPNCGLSFARWTGDMNHRMAAPVIALGQNERSGRNLAD